jgi:hypothetical protein
MFINESTHHIFQQHLNEENPLLVRIQINNDQDEYSKNDHCYVIVLILMVLLIVALTFATVITVFVS